MHNEILIIEFLKIKVLKDFCKIMRNMIVSRSTVEGNETTSL